MDDLKLALDELKEDSDSGKLGGATSVPQRSRRRFTIWASAAALLVLAAGYFLTYWQRSLTEAPPVSVVPLTNYQGKQDGPSFSPDGSMVAFHWNGEKQDNFDIYVKMVGGQDYRRLTTDPAPDMFPQWSPDGRQIAFLRGGFIHLITPLGGQERRLAPTRHPLAWSPDAKSIVAFDRESEKDPVAAFLVSTATGERRRLTSPPSGFWGDVDCAFAPDGRHLAVMRQYSNYGSDIHVLPLERGNPSGELWRLTSDYCQAGGMTWTPDSKEIVFSSNRGGRTGLWRIALTPGAVPERIPGTDDAVGPVISRRPPIRLAYARRIFDTNIWRMEIPAQGGRPVSSPARISPSSLQDMDPQISADGTKIAFISYGSGGKNLHVCGSDGSNPVQLTFFAGNRSAGSPRWSPDGRQIAFDGFIGENMHIFVIGAEGGAIRPVTTGASNNIRPSWSRDGRWIYWTQVDRDESYLDMIENFR